MSFDSPKSMAVDLSKVRRRKTTDINREHARFELIHNDMILLDVGFSSDGKFEVGFGDGIANVLVDWEKFSEIIKEGRKIAFSDR